MWPSPACTSQVYFTSLSEASETLKHPLPRPPRPSFLLTSSCLPLLSLLAQALASNYTHSGNLMPTHGFHCHLKDAQISLSNRELFLEFQAYVPITAYSPAWMCHRPQIWTFNSPPHPPLPTIFPILVMGTPFFQLLKPKPFGVILGSSLS